MTPRPQIAKQRALLLGSSGFVGINVADALRADGHHVAGAYRGRAPAFFVRGRLDEAVAADLADPGALRAAMSGRDVVFHAAGHYPRYSLDRAGAIATALRETRNVLDAAKAAGVSRVVFSSSAAVYGDDPRSPKTEDMTPAPKSPYGITKLDGEYYLKMYAEAHGVPTVSLRYFNVFGPRQDPRSVYAAAVPIFIERALDGRDITIFGDGEQTRDFVYVGDVVGANLLAATSDRAGRGEVFNVAQGGRITINELAQTIVRVTGSRSKIVHAPERIGDIRHSQASIARITQGLEFVPKTSLEEGLRACLATT